jgi:intein-encoded DNA endonuclease-like protein
MSYESAATGLGSALRCSVIRIGRDLEAELAAHCEKSLRNRVALYLRVNTKEQTVENQRPELTAVAERHRWELVREFADEGISGATSQRCVRTGNP